MWIYKITNLVNGKCYIGQTRQKPERRFSDHISRNYDSLIHKAIEKYGEENFSFEVIDSAETQKELNQKEIKWAEFYDSYAINGHGYNLRTCGGGDYRFTPETIEKFRERSSGENNPMYGKSHSEQAKERMRASHHDYSRSNHPRAKRVFCIETGIVFDCITDAAESVGVRLAALSNHLHGITKSCGGYHWKFCEEE